MVATRHALSTPSIEARIKVIDGQIKVLHDDQQPSLCVGKLNQQLDRSANCHID
jgi:hypothetical protein